VRGVRRKHGMPAGVAADELRERHAEVPEKTVARWAVMQYEIEQGASHELRGQIAAKGERYGITDELVLKALGPNSDEIAEDEMGGACGRYSPRTTTASVAALSRST
jgi:hypothetical protein